MLTKASVELPFLVEASMGTQTPEHKTEEGLTGQSNLAAKAGMAQELYVLGLSNEAIGRVLHVHEDALDSILKKSQ
ncbi:MAG: hypothetical protein Q7J31_04425 [Syntrophales bacterium]|nr:hypothetical protein [Syntrophales bacterium]